MPLPALPSLEALTQLTVKLAEMANSRGDSTAAWPREALRSCGQTGLYVGLSGQSGSGGSIEDPSSLSKNKNRASTISIGEGTRRWTDREIIECYLRLSAVDLTTTFIITQFMGAVRRLAGARSTELIDRWMPPLLSGEKFATVGISHLTTSRRHLNRPVLQAIEEDAGYRLNGFSPWVTGGPHADLLVVGASCPDGREILAAVPGDRAGVHVAPGAELVALTPSCTDRIDFANVRVEPDEVIAGPIKEVMSSGVGAGTGGLQTTTLALGLAQAATAWLKQEAIARPELSAAAQELDRLIEEQVSMLLEVAAGGVACPLSELRSQANSLALRSTQGAMTAAKGAGFVRGHPVGRWCREALFFLVWSCPQNVAQAHLCAFAGIE